MKAQCWHRQKSQQYAVNAWLSQVLSWQDLNHQVALIAALLRLSSGINFYR